MAYIIGATYYTLEFKDSDEDLYREYNQKQLELVKETYKKLRDRNGKGPKEMEDLLFNPLEYERGVERHKEFVRRVMR